MRSIFVYVKQISLPINREKSSLSLKILLARFYWYGDLKRNIKKKLKQKIFLVIGWWGGRLARWNDSVTQKRKEKRVSHLDELTVNPPLGCQIFKKKMIEFHV